MAEKKEPKVWKKIVLKLYWSTVQVLIKAVRKVDIWYRFRWEFKCLDEYRRLSHPINIEWYIDEYGNWWC